MRGFRVFFSGADRLVEAHPGENLLELARRASVHIDSSCGGNGSCHQCRVHLHRGAFPAKMILSNPDRFLDASGVGVPPFEEEDGRPLWLACRGQVMGDLVVEPAPRARQARTLVRKTLKGRRVPVDRPDLPAGSFVAAVDLGSTTLAGYLVDLSSGEIVLQASRENSQIPYGGDILNRVSYCERRQDGLRTMIELARRDLDEVLTQLSRQGGREIASVSVCGNSVMQSFLLGWPVDELGRDPFRAHSLEAQRLAGQDLGLASVSKAEVYVFPIQESFVGGDCLAAVLANDLDQFDGIALMMDIGTNGEIVVGGRRGLWSASTPTGPAFEGGEIVCGMRASRGAIDSVDFPAASTRAMISTIGGIPPEGLCGSAIIDCAAALYRAGICDREGKLAAGRFTRVRQDGVREVLLAGPTCEAVTTQGAVLVAKRDIVFTQKDLREVQLAKAALRTGADLLLKACDADRPPDRIVLAGGFGSYIDIESAIAIGLIPDLPRERIEIGGNSAGLGCAMAAASLKTRGRAESLAHSIIHVALPDDPEFQDRLLANIPWA